MGKATAATRSALPIPASVCRIFVGPNNGMAPNVWDFFMYAQMLMHVTAHGGCTNTITKSHWKQTLGEKFLASLGNWTCIGIVPGFSVQQRCYTKWVPPKPPAEPQGFSQRMLTNKATVAEDRVVFRSTPHAYAIHTFWVFLMWFSCASSLRRLFSMTVRSSSCRFFSSSHSCLVRSLASRRCRSSSRLERIKSNILRSCGTKSTHKEVN